MTGNVTVPDWKSKQLPDSHLLSLTPARVCLTSPKANSKDLRGWLRLTQMLLRAQPGPVTHWQKVGYYDCDWQLVADAVSVHNPSSSLWKITGRWRCPHLQLPPSLCLTAISGPGAHPVCEADHECRELMYLEAPFCKWQLGIGR